MQDEGEEGHGGLHPDELDDATLDPLEQLGADGGLAAEAAREGEGGAPNGLAVELVDDGPHAPQVLDAELEEAVDDVGLVTVADRVHPDGPALREEERDERRQAIQRDHEQNAHDLPLEHGLCGGGGLLLVGTVGVSVLHRGG